MCCWGTAWVQGGQSCSTGDSRAQPRWVTASAELRAWLSPGASVTIVPGVKLLCPPCPSGSGPGNMNLRKPHRYSHCIPSREAVPGLCMLVIIGLNHLDLIIVALVWVLIPHKGSYNSWNVIGICFFLLCFYIGGCQIFTWRLWKKSKTARPIQMGPGLALARWLSWLERCPSHQKLCRFDSRSRSGQEATDRCFSLTSMSLLPPLSLKVINIYPQVRIK